MNFAVHEGEMVAVMGPSGSGKSTLLYAVSGMDHITAGEVNFCGKSISGLNQKELAGINNEGTTIMLVTHDVKVAAKCIRVLYIVDGNIRGEYTLEKYDK